MQSAISAETASATTPSGTPIKIGMLVDSPDPATNFYESAPVAQAFVNNWNKHGGFKGHPIDLLIKDAALDPTSTIAGAQELVNNEGVVAMVDNTALLDCPVNASFYASAEIAVIPGTTSSSCTEKTGAYVYPYNGTTSISIGLKWAIQQGSKTFALVLPSLPGAGFGPTIANLQEILKKSGAKTKMITMSVPLTATAADWDAVIATLKGDGADTVMMGSTLPQTALALTTAATNSYGPKNGIRWIVGPAAYSKSAISPVFAGAYILSYTYPWSENNPDVKTALGILKNIKGLDGVDGLAYQDFSLIQSVLNEVKGPVTRQSVLAAIHKKTSIPLSLTSYSVDLASVNNLEGAQILVLKNGKFQAASKYLTVKVPAAS